MNRRALVRQVMAMPLELQRDALIPGYQVIYGAYGVDWDLNTASLAEAYTGRIEGTYFLPDIPQHWSGREGYLEVHKKLREVLNVRRVELDDVIPLGDGRVAALIRFVIDAGGDATIDQQVLDWHEFRDGEVVLQRIWLNREEGLRELGLV